MKYAARTDGPHKDIRAAFRAKGYYVKDMARVGAGWPDLLVVAPQSESGPARPFLVEVKNPSVPKSDRELTPQQVEVHKELKALGWPVLVITSVEQVKAL